MAPDTEPTDEELALVMREARELAVQRKAIADAWVAARLQEAAQFARENARPRRAVPSAPDPDDRAPGVEQLYISRVHEHLARITDRGYAREQDLEAKLAV